MKLPARAIIVWWRDLDKWIVPKRNFLSFNLPSGWLLVKVGEVVRQAEERVKVDHVKEYKMVGVRLYGVGTFHRETVKGDSLSATYVTPLVPNAFIYNRLFAWKGTFAVVPEEHADCFVSNEFPQFVVNNDRILPRYLYLFFMCDATIKAVNKASIGSSAVSRNRFKEEDFLDFEIPLPPLPIQQAIIKRWTKAKENILSIAGNISRLEHQAKLDFLQRLGIKVYEDVKLPKCFTIEWKDLERWSVEYLARMIIGLNNNGTGQYKSIPLSRLCSGQSGGTPSKSNSSYWNGNLPWVSPKDMKTFEIFDAQDHISEKALNSSSAPLIKPNSILVVVRSGILQRIVPIAINRVPVSINQDMRAFTPTDNRILPDFLGYYLSVRQDELLRLVKWSTTVQSINKEEMDFFQIPVPPIEVQKSLIQLMERSRAEIAREREAAERKSIEIKTEIEALILGTMKIEAL